MSPRRPASTALSLAVAAWMGASASGPAHAQVASFEDTLAIRNEIGASADLTNEQFVSFDENFVDTTFEVRRLVGTPERRYAGVLTTLVQGTRDARATRFEIRNDLSLGDLVQRDALAATWRREAGVDWRLLASPRLEYRHDRTFDRDRQELRAGLNASARRALGLTGTSAEAGTRLDLVRTRGEGAVFLLDRQGATLALALDHLGLFGEEWRLDYGLTGRVFPDSSDRDHLEHAGGLHFRRDGDAGHSITLDGRALKRSPSHTVAVSRDDYWSEEGTLEGDLRASPGWTVRAAAGAEAMQYAVEDDTLFFDYRVVRGRLGLRFDADPRWNLTAGPRVERLESPRNASESYDELAGAVELEILDGGAWWSVTPAAGRRRYVETSGPDALHSSYDFFELGAFFEQPIGAGLRVRGLGNWRYEAHDDETQDARSLYLSLSLLWAPR